MTPGLQRGPPFPAKAKKDAIVAIASLERPSVPRVVGICEINVAGLQEVQGAKGHAVRGEHWDGDEIWAWSNTNKAGGAVPEQIEGWDVNNEGTDIEDGMKNLGIDDQWDDNEDGGVPLGSSQDVQDNGDTRNPHVEGEDIKPYEKVEVEDRELTIKGA